MPLTEELIKRAVEAHPEFTQPHYEAQPSVPSSSSSSLSPNLASILGSLADGASTYKFMKDGNATENNAMYGSNPSPITAALGGVGMGLGSMAAAALLRKKWPTLANTLQAPLAGRQLAIGLTNLVPAQPGSTSDGLVSDSLTREIGRRR